MVAELDYEIMLPDVLTEDALDVINNILEDPPKATHLVLALEQVTDSLRYEHLSWPATMLHVLVKAVENQRESKNA